MNEPNLQNQRRLFFSFAIVCIVFLALIGRLGYIQIIKGTEYHEMALAQQTRSIPIPARRGDIMDRNGVKLAFTVKSFTVWARPEKMEDKSAVAEALSTILEMPQTEILETLESTTKDMVKVAKKIDREIADRVRQESIQGIWVGDDIKRVYPYGSFASHVIGHTTEDGIGIAGIEQTYDESLTGSSGKAIVNTDGHGRQLPFGSSYIYEPENGMNLELTIDEVIQHYMEKALAEALEVNQAKKVLAIMLDVKTGQVLGMASKPDYDLNTPRIPLDPAIAETVDAMTSKEKANLWNGMWRNPAVSDLYEPGSPFKLITGSISLEENVVNFNSTFECKGSVDVYGTKLRCWSWRNPHGVETFVEGMQNSCNPVFIELGTRLGADTFYHYIDNFGFTKPTGVDLPAEAYPLVRKPEDIGPVELATMTYGHGLSMSPLQMAAALGAIANDGKLMTPYLVKAIYDDSGNLVEEIEPHYVRQVVSEETSDQILEIMESVVTDGSGLKAYIPGYRIGGKTGTTNKAINGTYSEERVMSSFAAIAPVDDPQIALLIVVDEPKMEHYGSLVAAPVAKRILEDSLRYLEVEPVFEDNAQEITVPELVGMNLEEAKKTANNAGFKVDVLPENRGEGQYQVIDQYPKGHSKAMSGSTIILHVADQ